MGRQKPGAVAARETGGCSETSAAIQVETIKPN